VSTPSNPVTPARFKVLLAEDNETLRDLMSVFLAKTGVTWRLVSNGQEALEEWQRALRSGAAYDLFVTDVQMPVMDGIEAARAIRRMETQNGCAPVPIAFCTAYADNFPQEALSEVNAIGIWIKPDAILQLGPKILAALQSEKQEQKELSCC